MPAPIVFAHRLTRALSDARRSGTIPWLRPDGKSQVTVAYEVDRPVQVTAVVLSAQHEPDVSTAEIRDVLGREVILPSLPSDLFDAESAARPRESDGGGS